MAKDSEKYDGMKLSNKEAANFFKGKSDAGKKPAQTYNSKRTPAQIAASKAIAAHKAAGPFKTAADAINSPTFKAAHDAIKNASKSRRQGTSNGYMPKRDQVPDDENVD